MLEYINLYFEIKLYPIHYIFKNKNIDKNLIDLLIYYKAKLKYTNEEISIINILFNNKSLNKKKVFAIKNLNYQKQSNNKLSNILLNLINSFFRNNKVFLYNIHLNIKDYLIISFF